MNAFSLIDISLFLIIIGITTIGICLLDLRNRRFKNVFGQEPIINHGPLKDHQYKSIVLSELIRRAKKLNDIYDKESTLLKKIQADAKLNLPKFKTEELEVELNRIRNCEIPLWEHAFWRAWHCAKSCRFNLVSSWKPYAKLSLNK